LSRKSPLLAHKRDDTPPDDARVFVERIREAGGDARLLIGTALVHGRWRALETSPGVRAMHRAVSDFLREQARR
jgi:hypothetical protein